MQPELSTTYTEKGLTWDARRLLDDDDESEASLLNDEEKQIWKTDPERDLREETRRLDDNRRFGFSQWRWVLDATLLLVVLILLFERSGSRANRKYEIGDDVTGFAPKFSQQITTFTPSTTYVPDNVTAFFTDPSVKQAWVSLVPPGLGYLDIDRTDPSPSKSRKHSFDDLPAPLPEYQGQTVFTTSMTHQLHCLYAILEGYAGVKAGKEENGDHGHGHGAKKQRHEQTDTGTDQEQEDTEVEREEVEAFHLQHCFEYLRQSIVCAGDVALEGMQTSFPEGFTGSDGWDAKHVCRDYGQVYDYLEENRANDMEWIA